MTAANTTSILLSSFQVVVVQCQSWEDGDAGCSVHHRTHFSRSPFPSEGLSRVFDPVTWSRVPSVRSRTTGVSRSPVKMATSLTSFTVTLWRMGLWRHVVWADSLHSKWHRHPLLLSITRTWPLVSVDGRRNGILWCTTSIPPGRGTLLIHRC